MNMLTMLVMVAALLAMLSVAFGLGSMTADGEVLHRNSVGWMWSRVVAQAAAIAMILLALSGW